MVRDTAPAVNSRHAGEIGDATTAGVLFASRRQLSLHLPRADLRRTEPTRHWHEPERWRSRPLRRHDRDLLPRIRRHLHRSRPGAGQDHRPRTHRGAGLSAKGGQLHRLSAQLKDVTSIGIGFGFVAATPFHTVPRRTIDTSGRRQAQRPARFQGSPDCAHRRDGCGEELGPQIRRCGRGAICREGLAMRPGR